LLSLQCDISLQCENWRAQTLTDDRIENVENGEEAMTL